MSKRKYFSIRAAANGHGEIYIFDFIDYFGVNARGFVKELKALGDVSALDIHINSPGGDVFEGAAIYNILKQHKAEKRVFIDGLAASMASVVAMAGDTITMPENAMMMIHNPSTSAYGESKDMKKTAEMLDKIRDTLVSAYAAKTGLEDSKIVAIMDAETWLSAGEAIELGFADETTEAVKIAAAFDLSSLRNPPAAIVAAFGTANTNGGDAKQIATVQQESTTMDKTKVFNGIATALGLALTVPAVAALIADAVAKDQDAQTVTAALMALRPTDAAVIDAVSIQARVDAAIAVDRNRIAEIRATAKTLRIDATDTGRAMVEAMISDSTSVVDATRRMVAEVARVDAATRIDGTNSSRETFDNPEFKREAMATAIAAKYCPAVRATLKADAPAREWASYSIIDMAQDLVRASGVRLVGRDRVAIIQAALHTTSDFPYLLAATANKMLMPEYAAATPTYRTIAGEKTFNDFKAHSFARLGDFPDLLEVGEDGEIKRGTISENKETVTLASYGRIIGITRQALINDDLGAFADIATKAGRRVANWENALVYTALTQGSSLGPVLTDTYRLFSTNHANYTSSGTAVNLPVELGKSRALMRKQTGLDGLKLNLNPRYLVVGPDNETAAEQVTTSITPALASSVNQVGPRLMPVVDANISGYGWYMFAAPADAEVLIYGSLPGQSGPRFETRQGWSQEGVEFKLARDFGTGVVDYRGATFNAGTAPS
jgi:ATP-dependent Clp endopeptidase proteolytic subunit ClpP